MSAKPSGRRRGECAGVRMGVWSGVGERESCEKVGEGGAVEYGLLGLLLLAGRWLYWWSSGSCECDLEAGFDSEYWARLLLFPWGRLSCVYLPDRCCRRLM
jgi:hypothetical protein